jgi:hypothetical protein
MANPVKGEFTFDVGTGADKQTLTLVLDANALCTAEGMLGLTSPEIVEKIRSGNLTLLRTVLWVATRAHHDDVTVEDCGDMITEKGPLAVQASLTIGISKAFPSPSKGGVTARPTKGRTPKETA